MELLNFKENRYSCLELIQDIIRAFNSWMESVIITNKHMNYTTRNRFVLCQRYIAYWNRCTSIKFNGLDMRYTQYRLKEKYIMLLIYVRSLDQDQVDGHFATTRFRNNTLSGATDKDARQVYRRNWYQQEEVERRTYVWFRGTVQYISPRFTGRSLRRKCIVPDEAGTSGSQD